MPSAAQPSVSLSARTVASLEREIKFLVPAARSASLRAWLDSVSTPDRTYPPALVCTTYYDTPGLSLLNEKIDSDYLKTKVRIRWYASLAGDPCGSPVFAEVKYRVGGRRDKLRVRLEADPLVLERTLLQASGWKPLLELLRIQAPMVPAQLEPILSLRYARYRYLDRATQARLTVDENITLTALNPTRLPGRAPVCLPQSVFEYKGLKADLPWHLAPAIRFGARRGSCSKYLSCFQLATGLLL